MKIALLCPTRERVEKVQRLVNSLVKTSDNIENFILYLGVDADDPTIDGLKHIEKYNNFVKIIVIENNRTFLGLGVIWNQMVEKVNDEILAMIGDDMIFSTQGWDTEILKEFDSEHLPEDKIKMVFCNDGLRGKGNPKSHLVPLAVNSFLHRKYVKLTGRYVIDFKHGFHDTWLHDVFSAVNRIVFRHDILIKHLHFTHPDNNEPEDNVTKQLKSYYYSKANSPRVKYKQMKDIREKEIEMLKNHIKDYE